MDVLKVNRFRRSYHPGKSLGSDVRTQVIDTIIAEEGDRATGFIPLTYAQLSIKIVAEHCEKYTASILRGESVLGKTCRRFSQAQDRRR